jgi:VIT1/CCC1 family predicted Fe2+/Mn2+ transporter
MAKRAYLQLVRVASADSSGGRDYATAIINAIIIAGLSFFGCLVAIGISPDNDVAISIYRAFITAGVTFFSTLAASLGIQKPSDA